MLSLKKTHEKSIPLLSIVNKDKYKDRKTVYFLRDIYAVESKSDDDEEEVDGGKIKNINQEDLLHTNQIKLLKKAKKEGISNKEYYEIRNYLLKQNDSKLKKALDKNPPSEEIEAGAAKLTRFIKKANKKEITVNNSSNIYLNPYNRFGKRERNVYFISGASGSGKSTYAAKIIKNLQEYYKENKTPKELVIFSLKTKGEDPAFDQFKKAIYINLKELAENELGDLETRYFKNKIVLFDDVDILPKKILLVVQHVQSLMLELGRSYNIDTIVIHHAANNRSQTKLILQEVRSVILFPETMAYHSLKYTLIDKLGLEKDILLKVKRYERLEIVPLFKLIIHPRGCLLY
jgi:hypothetical protein